MDDVDDDETPRDVFEVRLTGTGDEIARVLQVPGLDIGCRHPHIVLNADRTETLYLQANAARIEAWRAAGLRVEQGASVFELGRSLQHEIGVGDRFDGGKTAPVGLGVKTNDPGGRRP